MQTDTAKTKSVPIRFRLVFLLFVLTAVAYLDRTNISIWAWAMNTPFQWGKQVASHFGGTRNPLVISWPSVIKDAGGLRSQFHHLIDIAPTILEAAQIPQPTEVNGVRQKPIEGVSMISSFDSASAPEAHHTQYFEIGGNRGVYQDGWIAAAPHPGLPGGMGGGGFFFVYRRFA